jgi:hypothetical protein
MVISCFPGCLFNLNQNNRSKNQKVIKRSRITYSGMNMEYFIKQTDTKFGSESVYLHVLFFFSLPNQTTELYLIGILTSCFFLGFGRFSKCLCWYIAY